MGLETGTFIDDLTPTWPTGSEKKSQGDDHLRLIKAVLKGTFPRAGKAFYFPTMEAISGTLALDSTDMNNNVEVDTTAGDVAVTLPSGLTSSDAGWTCEITKVSSDQNAAIVSPASGTILSKVGSTATIRVGVLCEPCRFFWNGTAWRAVKYGPMIGSTEEFNGATLPAGYLWEQGSSFSQTGFAELYAVLGTTIRPDKRGRVSFGKDNMNAQDAGRLTLIDGDTLLAVGGTQSNSLIQSQLPSVTFGFSGASAAVAAKDASEGSVFKVSTGGVVSVRVGDGVQVSMFNETGLDAPTIAGQSAPVSGGALSGGSGAAVPHIPNGIVVNKILRAC